MPHRLKSSGLISPLYVLMFAATAHCLNCRNNCIFTCLFPVCLFQLSTIKKKACFHLGFHPFIGVPP